MLMLGFFSFLWIKFFITKIPRMSHCGFMSQKPFPKPQQKEKGILGIEYCVKHQDQEEVHAKFQALPDPCEKTEGERRFLYGGGGRGLGLGILKKKIERVFACLYISSFRSPKKILAVEDDEKISEEETMPTENIPEAILAEILSRLPVKILLRFMCVCKLWCALIIDPAFVKMHLNRRSLATNSSRTLIFTSGDRGNPYPLYYVDLDSCGQQSEVNPVPVVKLDYRFRSRDNTLLGSCNGLLCIYNSQQVFLWNPSTRRHQFIPIVPIEIQCPLRNPRIVYGFGHDPTTDDYKLVIVVQSHGTRNSKVNVYSLSTDSWRRIRDMPFHLSDPDFGVLANSALHWVADRKLGPDSASRFIVVSFDLKDEEYREVSLPDSVDYNFHLNVGVLGGQLCVLYNFFRVRLEIWVMKDYGVRDSWVKQFLIEKPLVIRCLNSSCIRPILYSKNGKLILEKDSKELLSYDPQGGRSRYLDIPGVTGNRRPGNKTKITVVPAETCIGSLVPLNSGDVTEWTW